MIVVDASIVLPWFFADEPDTSAIAERVMRESAIVPSLFFLEIGNALLQAQKAGRIPKDAPFAALEHLEQLPILIEPTSNALAVTHLAAKYDLTTYDAAYLELALRLDIPLLTADQQLKRAGEATKAL